MNPSIYYTIYRMECITVYACSMDVIVSSEYFINLSYNARHDEHILNPFPSILEISGISQRYSFNSLQTSQRNSLEYTPTRTVSLRRLALSIFSCHFALGLYSSNLDSNYITPVLFSQRLVSVADFVPS